MKKLIVSDVHLGAPYSTRKEKLKELLQKDFDEVIINGDFYELLGFKSLDQIKKDNIDVMQIIADKKFIFVSGNHDLSVGLNEYTFNLPNGKKVIITHGHQFDGTEDKGFWTKVNMIFYYIFKYEPRRYLRKLKSYASLYAKAENFYMGKCDILIMGHTHQPYVDTDSFVYNSGDWLEHCSWIEIHDNEISLKQEN